MKSLTVAAALLLSLVSLQAKSTWTENYENALQTAKAENKMVLIDFTGSDWCTTCVLLSKEVFSQPEFQTFAEDNLVLLKIVFSYGTTQSPELKAQNRMLSEKYKVIGFPTIVVLNSSGKNIGELTYMPGGPAPFIAELKKLQGK